MSVLARTLLLVVLMCFAVFFQKAQAQEKRAPRSVFFTQNEMEKIDEALSGKKENAGPPSAQAIRLDSLMYFEPSRWIFWLNGKKWTPETREPNIEVLSVTQDSVTLALVSERESGAKRIVTLRVSQSASAEDERPMPSFQESR